MAGGGGGGGSYSHSGFTRTVSVDDAPIEFRFTAQATMLVDEVNILCQNIGNRPISFYASIVDVKSGKTIGNKVLFSAPTVSVEARLVSGLRASVAHGRLYKLTIGHVTDNYDSLVVSPTRTVNFTTNLNVYGYTVSDHIWRIQAGSGFISIGGWQSYQATGKFTRTFDVGVIKQALSQDGRFIISDIIPNGTLMSIDLYFTDLLATKNEPGLQNWTFFASNVNDGISLPKHRYWRALISMESNSTRDLTPELASIQVSYRAKPKTFGTVIDTKKVIKSGFFLKTAIPMVASQSMRVEKNGAKNLSSFNLQSSKVNPKFQVSIGGGFTASIAEDDYSNNTFNKPLISREAVVRVGYRSINSTFDLYKAKLSDFSYRKGSYNISAKDASDLFKIKIPSAKSAPAWSSLTAYTAGDVAVFFSNKYVAVSNNTGLQPDLNTAVWNAVGGAWNDIIYDDTTKAGGWHLIDMLVDIISNRVNIHSSLIDIASFEIVKLLTPGMIGTFFIRKPTDAAKVIQEISWLLESHVVIRDSKVSIVKEPSLSDIDLKVFDITGTDVKENTLSYKAGWKNWINECIIISSYDNSGDSNTSNFGGGEVVVDADSVQEFDGVSSEIFKDKFNIGSTQLQNRASSFVSKWKSGRSICMFETDIRRLSIDIMDVVNINSLQLPLLSNRNFTGLIVSKDVDWLRQKIRFTSLELK